MFMNNRSLRHAIAPLAAIVALTAAAPHAAAQNESGRRPINKERFVAAKLWYDTTTALYHHTFPILQSLPPLNSGMPWDVMAAYIVADSIARFDATNMVERGLRLARTLNDTIRGIARYLYAMADYNPVLLKQYGIEVSLDRGNRYHASILAIAQEAKETIWQATPNRTDARALFSGIQADYILRVHIIAVDSMVYRQGTYTDGSYVYRVTCVVLDTLKGRVFPSCTGDADNRDAAQQASAGSCIQFLYTAKTWWDPNATDMALTNRNHGGLAFARDSAFCTGAIDSTFRMRTGQEAIVFLSYRNHLYDSTHDHIQLDLDPLASFGALPIINGRVRDVNHFWTNDLWTDYPAWRLRFLAIRNQLLTGSY